jgi:hypothetical protein
MGRVKLLCHSCADDVAPDVALWADWRNNRNDHRHCAGMRGECGTLALEWMDRDHDTRRLEVASSLVKVMLSRMPGLAAAIGSLPLEDAGET